MKAKRLISFLLALTMAVSLLGGICLTASAVEQETPIPVLEISGIPGVPVVGETVQDGAAIVPEGAGYTAEYFWCKRGEWSIIPDDGPEENWDYGWPWLGFEGVIENGEVYTLNVEITIYEEWDGWQYWKDGEAMPVQISVNGGEQIWDREILYAYSSPYEEHYTSVGYWDIFYFTEEITRVDITGVPEVVPGAVASVDNIQVAEDANYTILEANWYNYNDYAFNDVTVPINGETFQQGERYVLLVELNCKTGYHFADECDIYMDGIYRDTDSYGSYPYRETCTGQYNDRANMPVDAVEFSYTGDGPVAGQSPYEWIGSDEDSNYYTTLIWCEYDEESGLWYAAYDIVAGQEYLMTVDVQTMENYKFSDDVEVRFNGELLSSDEYEKNYDYINRRWLITMEGQLYVAQESPEPEETEPDEKIVIDSVMISNLQAPVAGELLDDSVTVLTEGCTAELNWSVYDGEGVLPVTGTAEKGKDYCLDITLTANEGYSFAEELQIWQNGEQVWANYWNKNEASLSFWYDTCEIIESVEITSTDKGELGAAATTDGVSVPEGANYTVSAYWAVLNMEDGLVPFEGVFADNTVYAYTVNAEPAEGYKFAEDLTVTYNGEPVSEDFLFYDSRSLEVVGEVFTGTMQKVRKVEINARFKAGMKASDAVVEVPEDAPYEITEYYWVDLETGDELTGKFVAGKQYGLMAFVAPKAGYVIDMAAQTAVNGKDDYELMQSQYAYIYGQTAVVLDCESGDTNGNPSTGDDSEIVLLWAVMLLSVIGLISVLTADKRRYQ